MQQATQKVQPAEYCAFEKEDKYHLVTHCNHGGRIPVKPTTRGNFGPNFDQAGVVEVRPQVVKTRLQCSTTASIPLENGLAPTFSQPLIGLTAVF